MGRPLRPQFEGAIYHVSALGVRRSPIFVDDDDRRMFLGFLANVIRRTGWELHSFCLMTTHYHLLVTTPAPNIAQGMQVLNTRYALLFNQRHGHTGHVFQGRYSATLIESEAHLLEVYRYIALNPVRAGLCDRPEEWPWSSYRLVVLGEPPPVPLPPLVLPEFGDGEAAAASLRRFVELGI